MADDDGLPLDAQGKPDLARAPVWVRFLAGLIDEGNGQKAHLHECLHRIEKVVQEDRHSARNRDMAQDQVISELKSVVSNITESFDGLKGEVSAIALGLGVGASKDGEAKPRKTLALISKPQAIFALLGAVGGGLLVYKILAILFDGLMAAWPGIHAALMGLK